MAMNFVQKHKNSFKGTACLVELIMKKMLKSISFIFLAILWFGQSNYQRLTAENYNLLLSTDNVCNVFTERSNQLLSDPSITLDNVIMEGYSKDSSVRDIITKLNESNNFDYVIDIYNTQNFESIFYFEKYTLLQNEFKTTVYDENKTALYNTVSSRSTTDLIPIEQVQQRASCFKTCFDALVQLEFGSSGCCSSNYVCT